TTTRPDMNSNVGARPNGNSIRPPHKGRFMSEVGASPATSPSCQSYSASELLRLRIVTGQWQCRVFGASIGRGLGNEGFSPTRLASSSAHLGGLQRKRI